MSKIDPDFKLSCWYNHRYEREPLTTASVPVVADHDLIATDIVELTMWSVYVLGIERHSGETISVQ